ncbi:hypothetical protein PILCRDRAFT_87905 [Piloderma croceum F 1598]|uniref:Protein kinase domain-containing protein n=1 Tax=Piloderma croceum (strain F 1598) TaxID=765440 RepID=A0A0C3C348_PILCF|nr:hypothetical protein PILCRDRAFT_87905 [Piloderma croceum F 1598]
MPSHSKFPPFKKEEEEEEEEGTEEEKEEELPYRDIVLNGTPDTARCGNIGSPLIRDDASSWGFEQTDCDDSDAEVRPCSLSFPISNERTPCPTSYVDNWLDTRVAPHSFQGTADVQASRERSVRTNTRHLSSNFPNAVGSNEVPMDPNPVTSNLPSTSPAKEEEEEREEDVMESLVAALGRLLVKENVKLDRKDMKAIASLVNTIWAARDTYELAALQSSDGHWIGLGMLCLYQMTAAEELVLNAVETVILHGLCVNSDGKDTSLILSRVSPEPVRPYLFDALDGSYPPAPSPRPSSLPPPGHLQLELTLASELGSGRVGHVYALDDSKTKISAPSSSDVFVHPLVVKVAGRDISLSTDLTNEAWNYEEMECIQGVEPWFDKGHTETTVKNDLVSVLVLERVGGHLTMPKKLSDEDKLLVGNLTIDVNRDQIYGLYRELAYLSIAHRDIRYYNILYAPPSLSLPVPFQHKKSPFTNRTYKYRLVDFDRSRRINLTFKEQAINDLDWIEKIIDELLPVPPVFESCVSRLRNRLSDSSELNFQCKVRKDDDAADDIHLGFIQVDRSRTGGDLSTWNQWYMFWSPMYQKDPAVASLEPPCKVEHVLQPIGKELGSKTERTNSTFAT